MADLTTVAGPHPVVVGLLRTDIRAVRNRALAAAVLEAETGALRAAAAEHGWRLVDVLLLPAVAGGLADPVEYLLAGMRRRHADAVLTPDRQHLRDLHQRDCLDTVCRTCAVATLSPEQLWLPTEPTSRPRGPIP